MRFVRKKLVQLVVVLLCVTFLSFLMISMLPGDTAEKLCAGAGGQECELREIGGRRKREADVVHFHARLHQPKRQRLLD